VCLWAHPVQRRAVLLLLLLLLLLGLPCQLPHLLLPHLLQLLLRRLVPLLLLSLPHHPSHRLTQHPSQRSCRLLQPPPPRTAQTVCPLPQSEGKDPHCSIDHSLHKSATIDPSHEPAQRPLLLRHLLLPLCRVTSRPRQRALLLRRRWRR
jgi:hypothetical protein